MWGGAKRGRLCETEQFGCSVAVKKTAQRSKKGGCTVQTNSHKKDDTGQRRDSDI